VNWRDTLAAWIRPQTQERSLTPAQIWGRGLEDWYASQSAAGYSVTVETAMRAALGSCVRLLADDIASLPVDAYRKSGEDTLPIDPPDWLRSPTGRRWDTMAAHISDVVTSYGSDGNIFLLCFPNVEDAEVLQVLDPVKVDIGQRSTGAVEYKDLTTGKTFGEDRVLHIPWLRLPGQLRGLSVIQAAKESTGLELAAREWASRFFSNGATLGGIIEIPRESGVLTQEQLDDFKAQFKIRNVGTRKSWALGVLQGGATYNATAIKPQEAELEPLWRHVLEEACRIYHIPPHLMASQSPGAQGYASVEHRSIEYVVHAVVPIVRRIEAAYSQLIPGDDTFIKFNLNGLLRGDVKTRGEFYQIMTAIKAMRPEEVRALEDLPRDPENTGYLETPNNTPQPAAEPAEDEGRGLSLTLNDAPITMAPEVRIDSVAVSEAGVAQIAEASTTGIAAGISVLGESIAQDNRALSDTFTGALTRVEETARLMAAELADVKARQAAAEEREAKRRQPVQFDIRRDESGRTSEVYVRQGEKVTRKSIRHDANGRVIGVFEEAMA
jgi:HK97 family phage portal protein